jgi:hypothetical protein
MEPNTEARQEVLAPGGLVLVRKGHPDTVEGRRGWWETRPREPAAVESSRFDRGGARRVVKEIGQLLAGDPLTAHGQVSEQGQGLA